MPLIAAVGASFSCYGADDIQLGWVDGIFVPTPLASNPHGIVQAGVHSLLADAAINFALNASLRGKERTRATLDLKTETMRPAMTGQEYTLRGKVVRLARIVAFGEATICDDSGKLISRSTGTFILKREE